MRTNYGTRFSALLLALMMLIGVRPTVIAEASAPTVTDVGDRTGPQISRVLGNHDNFVEYGRELTFAVTVSDTQSRISKIVWYVDGQEQSCHTEDGKYGYSVHDTWTTDSLAVGAHSIQVHAWDVEGNCSVSEEETTTVLEADDDSYIFEPFMFTSHIQGQSVNWDSLTVEWSGPELQGQHENADIYYKVYAMSANYSGFDGWGTFLGNLPFQQENSYTIDLGQWADIGDAFIQVCVNAYQATEYGYSQLLSPQASGALILYVECPHEERFTVIENLIEGAQPVYEDSGDGFNHIVKVRYSRTCGYCGTSLEEILKESGSEPHNYVDGKCVCGAIENKPPEGSILLPPVPVQSIMTVNRGETVTISWYASEGAERYGVWLYDTNPGTYVDVGTSLSVTHVFEHNNPKDAPFAVQIYALAGTGENQKQSEPATVLVTVGCEDGKHDFTGATVYDRTLYKEIPGDHEFHLAYADVYKQTCIECGMGGFETTIERDAAQQEKVKHSYVDGVCQVEGCKHVCVHQYEYKLENGLNVPVKNSGRWVMVDENYCKKLVRYWEQCAYCGLEREGTTEHEDGSVSKHIIGTVESYTPLVENDPDYTTKHLWTTTYQPCANKCGYDPQKATKTERREHTMVDGKCVECGYLNQKPLQKAGLFKFWPSPDLEDGESLVYGYVYDENWFFEDSTKYQHDLVKMSVRVAMAAYGTGRNSSDSNIRYLMEDCLEFYDVETSYPKPTVDTVGYAIGRKSIVNDDGEKCTLVMVAVRSGNYFDEWGDNFKVGVGAHHQGFNNAANNVYDAILSYLEKHEDEMIGDTKIWISGYSRGAAVANLVAAKLHPTNSTNHDWKKADIYAFCFECPQNSDTATSAGYEYIFNFVNPIDFVPKVVMSDWGYSRYGVTYYTPYLLGGAKDYGVQKVKMVDEYVKLLKLNKFPEAMAVRVTSEFSTQERLLNDFMSALAAGFTNKNVYTTRYQTDLVQLVLDKLGTGKLQDYDLVSLLTPLLPQLPILIAKGYLSIDNIVRYMNIGTLSYAHYAELCMAWLDSLEGEFSYADPTYRILFVNCPVDIKIYDSNNNLVGSISGEESSESEYGIVTYIDFNGQKTIALPNNEEYTIQITATDNGTVTYTATEFNIDTGKNEKVVSYFEVPVVAGEVLTGIAENIGSTGTGTYPLYRNGDSTTLTPSLVQSDDEVVDYRVTVSSVGNGQAIGGGLYAGGEFARVVATPDAEELFYGWYVDDVLVSSDMEYRFLVNANTCIEARFTDTAPVMPPDTGDDTPLGLYMLLLVLSSCILAICARKKKIRCCK